MIGEPAEPLTFPIPITAPFFLVFLGVFRGMHYGWKGKHIGRGVDAEGVTQLEGGVSAVNSGEGRVVSRAFSRGGLPDLLEAKGGKNNTIEKSSFRGGAGAASRSILEGPVFPPQPLVNRAIRKVKVAQEVVDGSRNADP